MSRKSTAENTNGLNPADTNIPCRSSLLHAQTCSKLSSFQQSIGVLSRSILDFSRIPLSTASGSSRCSIVSEQTKISTGGISEMVFSIGPVIAYPCLLYTSDAADE